MLYVEEVFMYFVEEARIGCRHDISYGHELDIWRNDIHEDRSGIFSYYLLYRFGDPNLGYLLDTRLPLRTSAERIAALVQQARLPEMSLFDICANARRFKGALAFPIAEPDYVTEVCASPSESTIFIASGLEGARDHGYCREVHGEEQSLLNWLISWLRSKDQSLGELYVPN